ncbi:CAP domain-containing protein [Pontibacter vulgaris]|uniref:CAP domain-containing protein n=1 Tax=Pontibacter vulgaris TaxID=2905679 RepID=UPI001FA6F067|nr:CAP domain-containing protein [Pontibacter vulgaris]
MEWTAAELRNADTGRNATYLNDTEKETLLYLNLARLYPKKYARVEIPSEMLLTRGEKANWQAYRRSLLKDLNEMKPAATLTPDSYMTSNAKCFAKESGIMGKTGHQRELCKKENFAECNAYGIKEGRAIVMNLLIDYNVPNLGHRKHMLDSTFSSVGIGYDKHVKYRQCLVLVIQ